ncbi:plasmid mobilization protein [Staphylococcus xylosus]|uniref:plasmid mobilization protein n=1 Tax=Staphylococcus xylosus TaxID=1288 RepID=UPI003CF187BE
MTNKSHRKAKTININLTEEEYKKVKALAEDRDLNPIAYTRLAALGNRIKPTVVYNTDEYTEQLKKEKQTLEMALETSVPKEDVELLEAQCESYKTYIDTFKKFLQYVQEDAEYINLNGYKRDEQLKAEMKDAIKSFFEN